MERYKPLNLKKKRGSLKEKYDNLTLEPGRFITRRNSVKKLCEVLFNVIYHAMNEDINAKGARNCLYYFLIWVQGQVLHTLVYKHDLQTN